MHKKIIFLTVFCCVLTAVSCKAKQIPKLGEGKGDNTPEPIHTIIDIERINALNGIIKNEDFTSWNDNSYIVKNIDDLKNGLLITYFNNTYSWYVLRISEKQNVFVGYDVNLQTAIEKASRENSLDPRKFVFQYGANEPVKITWAGRANIKNSTSTDFDKTYKDAVTFFGTLKGKNRAYGTITETGEVNFSKLECFKNLNDRSKITNSSFFYEKRDSSEEKKYGYMILLMLLAFQIMRLQYASWRIFVLVIYHKVSMLTTM